jgi:hypothetical protein
MSYVEACFPLRVGSIINFNVPSILSTRGQWNANDEIQDHLHPARKIRRGINSYDLGPFCTKDLLHT